MRAYPATTSLAKYLPGRPRAASRRRPHPPMLHALPRPADLRLPATFGSLRHRDYRIWWFGLLVSLVGTWMQSVAQGWLVLDLTGSPVSLGTVTALQFLPVLLLALPGGVVADWLPRRRLIFLTQSVALVQALALSA